MRKKILIGTSAVLILVIFCALLQMLVMPKYVTNPEGALTGEYYADAGSVDLGCSPEKMASALYKLVYGAAKLPESEIKDVEGTKAFFLTDISNARNEFNNLAQLDLDKDGKISAEELNVLRGANVKVGASNKIMELLSTHPDMLKRIKRLP